MPAPDYVPVIISAATALSVGFGAAGLKHRWDSKDDQKRWDREREQRYQEALRDAFSDYLAARQEVVNAYLVMAPKPTQDDINRNTVLITRYTWATHRLQLFIEDHHDLTLFAADTLAVNTFLKANIARLEEVHEGAAEPTTPRPALPGDGDMSELAHKLLYSPAAPSVRGPRHR
jgi:hypothetical protein